ncbi:L-rhamnose mutarotase [Formosa sp. 4Alg 33]|uniref:L-rhamnose mutarotase n=1 Tax=Formosa sp. 4Alg 33 TaxID=3382189 RepID=UPI003D9C6262
MRYCYALDLVDDETLIKEYIEYHKNVWPEIEQSILDSGIEVMEIYHVGNRLFMITEEGNNTPLDERPQSDQVKAKIDQWETLMWTYQQALPIAKKGEKWVLMENIYQLKV